MRYYIDDCLFVKGLWLGVSTIPIPIVPGILVAIAAIAASVLSA